MAPSETAVQGRACRPGRTWAGETNFCRPFFDLPWPVLSPSSFVLNGMVSAAQTTSVCRISASSLFPFPKLADPVCTCRLSRNRSHQLNSMPARHSARAVMNPGCTPVHHEIWKREQSISKDHDNHHRSSCGCCRCRRTCRSHDACGAARPSHHKPAFTEPQKGDKAGFACRVICVKWCIPMAGCQLS